MDWMEEALYILMGGVVRHEIHGLNHCKNLRNLFEARVASAIKWRPQRS
jgi:hypothetical protein